MVAILMSVQPKYCELIARGDKTRELRKTKPKIATPFKVYVYCTKPVDVWGLCRDEYGVGLLHRSNFPIAKSKGLDIIHGAVIGEFICDEITDYPYEQYNDGEHVMPYGELERLCLDGIEVYDYLRTEDGYGWHITDFKLYDKPRALGELLHECNGVCVDTKKKIKCERIMVDGFSCNGLKPITKPPQSWCYVEERSISVE